MTYLWLALAVLFEIGWAVGLKLSKGFTVRWAAALTLICYALSLLFLAFTIRRMEIGPAYAVWTGLGAAAIAAIGVIYFNETFTIGRVVSIVLIIAGVVGVNLSGGPK